MGLTQDFSFKAADDKFGGKEYRNVKEIECLLKNPQHCYSRAFDKCRHEAVASGRHLPLTIDATPIYLHRPIYATKFAAASPKAAVLIMLRNPITKIRSLYKYWFDEG